MKLFKELTIHLESEADAAQLVEHLSANLPGHWRRGIEYEERVGGLAEGVGACFVYTGEAAPPAGLWLGTRGLSMYVTNVVPFGGNQLTKDEYNRIVSAFEAEVVRRNDIAVESGPEAARITRWISSDAERLLVNFSIGANQSTGISHPMDEQRWFDFVLRLHAEGADLPAEALHDWLSEDGWPDDVAWDLVTSKRTRKFVPAADASC